MPAGRTLQPRGPVHVSIVAFSVTQCQLIDATTIVGVDDDGIELQSAADRLGVHYQTAYGWVRSGRLPATLVRRRYRIAPAALAAFAAERDRPRRPGPRRPRNGFTEVSRKMSADLVAGEEGRARAVVDRLVADGVELTTVMQDVLAPTLRLVETSGPPAA
jgi:excisionase family DNA binding protein